MKTIIAYILLILGLPILIGSFASTILIILFKSSKIPDTFFEVIAGIFSSLIAFYMFVWLGVNVSIIIPVILSVVSYVWYSTRKKRKQSYWNILGIFIGWVIIV
jgi:hypothetical protein